MFKFRKVMICLLVCSLLLATCFLLPSAANAAELDETDLVVHDTGGMTEVSGLWRFLPYNEPVIPGSELFVNVTFSVVAFNSLLEPFTYNFESVRIFNDGSFEFVGDPIQVSFDGISFCIDFGPESQLVPSFFTEWLSSVAQPEEYKTLPAGVYRVKGALSPPLFDFRAFEGLQFYCSGHSTDNDILYTAYCSGFLWGEVEGTSLAVGVYKTTPDYPEKVPMFVFTHLEGSVWEGWVYDDPSIITIPKDATVSASFADWFITNTDFLNSVEGGENMGTSVVSSIVEVFTAVGEWIFTTLGNVGMIFFAPDTGLTFIGAISLFGAGVATIYGMVALIRSWVKRR